MRDETWIINGKVLWRIQMMKGNRDFDLLVFKLSRTGRKTRFIVFDIRELDDLIDKLIEVRDSL